MGSRDVTVSESAVSRSSIWARFARDRRGAVAVAVAVLLPVLVGFAGIGIEIGLWFAIQRQNQSAADAAAISAALEYAAQIENGVTTNPAAATAAATTSAGYNLFNTNPPNTLTLYPCYGFTVGSPCNTSSSYGALNAVQVALTQPLNTAFANFVTAIWGPNVNPVNVTTTAIAALPPLPGGQTCLLAVGSSQTLSVGGSTTLNLPNCTLASLSTLGNSIQLPGSGNPTINAAAIATTGNVQMTDGSSPPPHTFTYLPLHDPYKTVTTIPLTGSIPSGPCNTIVITSGTFTVPSTIPYCGVTITGTANVMFSGGTYYIGSGGITIVSPAIVAFGPGLYYLYGGSFNIGSFTLRPAAPTSIGSTTLIFSSSSGVAFGMTVTDTTQPAAIRSGTTVTDVQNGQVTLSSAVVNPGVSTFDTIQFTGPSGGSVTGTGITIVLTASGGRPTGGIDIERNACGTSIALGGTQTGQGLLQPSATASQGLLFFQDPTGTPAPNVIANNCAISNVTLNGAIYTPASSDTLQGNFSASFAGCTEFIAQSFNFSGNVGLDDSGCSAVGITLNQAQIQQVYLAM